MSCPTDQELLNSPPALELGVGKDKKLVVLGHFLLVWHIIRTFEKIFGDLDVLWSSNWANQNLCFCKNFALSTLIAMFSKCSLLFQSLCKVVVVMELKRMGLVVVVVVAVVVMLVVVVSVVVRY